MNEDNLREFLDHYESNGRTVWRWKRGRYSSQEFASEQEAVDASESDELTFSRLDGGDALDDLLKKREIEPPFDYWIVENSFVMEPSVGGMILGEVPGVQLPVGAKILSLSQEEFDELQNDFFMREGYYPDT